MTPEAAKELSLKGIGYLAGNHEELARFLSLSGLAPEDIRSQATQHAFQIAILDFFLGHEPTLVAFAASVGIDPADIATAKRTLDPETPESW